MVIEKLKVERKAAIPSPQSLASKSAKMARFFEKYTSRRFSLSPDSQPLAALFDRVHTHCMRAHAQDFATSALKPKVVRVREIKVLG